MDLTKVAKRFGEIIPECAKEMAANGMAPGGVMRADLFTNQVFAQSLREELPPLTSNVAEGIFQVLLESRKAGFVSLNEEILALWGRRVDVRSRLLFILQRVFTKKTPWDAQSLKLIFIASFNYTPSDGEWATAVAWLQLIPNVECDKSGKVPTFSIKR